MRVPRSVFVGESAAADARSLYLPPFYLFLFRMTFTGNFEGVKLNKIK